MFAFFIINLEIKHKAIRNIKTWQRAPIFLTNLWCLVFNPIDLNLTKLHRRARPNTWIHHNVRNYLIDYIDLAILHQNKSTPVLLKFADYPSAATEDLNYSYLVFGKVRDLVAEQSENHVRYHELLKSNLRTYPSKKNNIKELMFLTGLFMIWFYGHWIR